ncbi:isocitrate lyase [Candidatus Bathyarchaeota archaeon]|nr:MAG: isocitrate lyase [Candidatus Bathyarchaeota archaeon]
MNRWEGILRGWTEEDVRRLRGPFQIEYTLAFCMSTQLWYDMLKEDGVRALGASTPAQAVQMVQAGLKGIYLSGWQVAADVNGHMYPDQSLYPSDCVPKLAAAINAAMLRQSKIHNSEDQVKPIIADGEAGFGGALNVFELTKRMIEAGVAGVHYEDQLSSEKKCGHLGGKVLVPTSEFIKKLKAARLAADVCRVPTVIIARTDADSAKLITNDVDLEDSRFIITQRTPEGFWKITGGLDQAIQRGLAYAPYADAIWCETSKPDIGQAREFAEAIHEKFPGKLLAYNCSPSFNWSKHLSHDEIRGFQDGLNELGYKFQFVTLAGFHSLNNAMFELAVQYDERGMSAYSLLQNREFKNEVGDGYGAAKHQKFVGTGYFDDVRNTIDKDGSTGAMADSTETEQF